MAPSTFVLVMLFGASAIAFWAFARFPRLVARSPKAVFLHLLASAAAAQLALPAGLGLVTPVDSRAAALALVAITLPALTYLMLASLWLLNLARQLLGNYNR